MSLAKARIANSDYPNKFEFRIFEILNKIKNRDLFRISGFGFRNPEVRDGHHQERGVVLVGAVVLMIFLALFTAVGTSLIATSAGSFNNRIYEAQALAIAKAGAEWYSKRLSTDSNWSDEVPITQPFGGGTFTITINSFTPAAAAKEINFTSTGSVNSPLSGVAIQRYVSLTVQKISSAFQFGLYQGRDPGAALAFSANGTSPTQISGDAWVNGSATISSPNVIQNGKIYAPSTRTVTGTTNFKLIPAPYPVMPVIKTTNYASTISGYDSSIASDSSNVTRAVTTGQIFNISTDAACSGTTTRICNFQNFTTSGDNVVITANVGTSVGMIVANQSISLHGADGLSGNQRLTISPPSGAQIVFLAKFNLTIGSNNNTPIITVNPGSVFYAANEKPSATTRVLTIRGSQTQLNASKVMAGRHIVVQTGADLLNDSLLFVDYPGNNTNNLIDVVGDANVTSIDGTLISLSQDNPGIFIENASAAKDNVVITGIIYGYGSSTLGICQIENATIRGSVACLNYKNNRIYNTAINYDPSYLPAVPPDGFDGFVMKKSNSYTGL